MNEKLVDIQTNLESAIKDNIEDFKMVKPLEGEMDIEDFRRLVVQFPLCFFVMSNDSYTDMSGENNRKFGRDITWDFFIGVKNLKGSKYRSISAFNLLKKLKELLVSDKWEFIPKNANLLLDLEGGSIYLFRFVQQIHWSRDFQET